jgi:hypothetical protein
MTSYQYVPARTSHILHLILTCMTLGLWSPVWFFVWLHNHNRMVPRVLPARAPGQKMYEPYGYRPLPGPPPQYSPGVHPTSDERWQR